MMGLGMCIWEKTLEKSCIIEGEEFGVPKAILKQRGKKAREGRKKEEAAGRRQKDAQVC